MVVTKRNPIEMTKSEYMIASMRHRRLSRLLDTSEIAFLAIVFVWGLQLALVYTALKHDPETLMALTSLTPYVAMPLHGSLLLVLAAIHITCILADNTGGRRKCIGFETLFFLYVVFTLLLKHRFGLELAGPLVYFVFSVANFHSLMRPPDAKT